MATPPPEPLPLILTNASLKINGQELACVTNHLELSPDVSVTTVDTFCGSKDYPGVVKWSLVATLIQSFDPAATEDVLSQAYAAYLADGTLADFEMAGYRDRAAGTIDNPTWSGQVIPQPYSPINGDAGDVSTVDLEWSLSGEPQRTPAVVLAGG
ncbi:MAG: hypothetical protein J2P43_01535 [Candidatus Dormibacteraeota bacterium]|nr:hypothetical protein [Candidatus Dormibacteraeota bacterium]